MKKYGTTQRRYGIDAPSLFDKATKKVCIDVQPCEIKQTNERTGEEEVVDGYSWIEMYLGDTSLDYGSVKSKLIEFAYAPKDEFAFLMNAMAIIIENMTDEQKELEDIQKFMEMNEWRSICAAVAKAVCTEVGTLLPTT